MSSGPSAPEPAQTAGHPASSSSTTIQTPAQNGNSTSASASNTAKDGNLNTTPAPMGSSSKKRKASPPPRLERNASLSHDPQTDDDNASVITSGRQTAKDHKRTRVHFSCVECHRRKQKCDRKEPCSQCVARRVPHLCRPFLNGVEDPNTNSDVHARLNSIEHLLGQLLSSVRTNPQPTLSLALATDHSSPDVSTLTASGEEIFHPKSAPPTSSQQLDPPRQIMPHKPPPSGLFPSNMSYTTPPGRSGFGWGLREGRMINLVTDDNIELKEVLATLSESGISKSHLEWVIAGVPGRRMADGLVELYFREIDWTRYKMNKPSFMKKYTVFFDSIGRNPTSPRIDAEILKWLPLMFIVLAIAALSAPHEVISSEEQHAWSRRFYGSARSSLEYAKALQRDNLDVLFAGLLASRYMLLTRRPAEGSTPLTTAFQLGLYRDGTVLNLSDKREVEVRRRAWAMLYHLDRTISLLVGRPASISDAHTDTRMPANLDDDELEGDFDPAGHPLSKPTVYTYVILRHKLAEIMGRIAYHTFAIQLPDYSTVLNLDRDLVAWRDSLPSFFALSNPDTSLDKDHSYLFVQRHLLACEWFYTRITLNRPYLLRRKPQDGRYAYSKNAAIESATADLLSRRAFVMEKGNLIVNSGGYRVLNSYMVLGVTIKLDPDSPQADELRQLLNIVSGRAPDSQGRVSEPLVKEELAIVEFLTAKTNYAKSTNSSSDKPRGEDQTPVDLLLGLAKTRSGKRAAEEEKRQLRLQQYREAEEARAVQRRNNGMASPWGYVAPSMPGLDVQQPFGNQSQAQLNAQSRRGPRPLQPPPSRGRSSQDMSSGIQTLQQHAQNQQQQHQQQQQQHQQQQQQQQNAVQSWNPDIFSQLSDFSQPPFARQNNAQQRNQNASPSQTSPFSLAQFSGLSNVISSPNNPLANLSGDMVFPQPGQQQLQQQNPNNLGQNLNGTNSGGNPGQEGMPQFGQAIMDQFDFSDLGLFNGGNGTTNPDGSFNPFALAQNQNSEESDSPGMGEDDQTQFLNYILTKIANSQPEVQ